MAVAGGASRGSSPLKGRVAVVTGAAQGIGRGIAQRFATDGAHVVLVDVRDEALSEVVDQLAPLVKASGGSVQAAPGDVADPETGRHLARSLKEQFNRCDILVNNAGIQTPAYLVRDLPLDDWQRVMDINLTGALLMSQAVLPMMQEAGYGRIINIGSSAGLRISYNGSVNYTAAKAGLIALTRQLAYEVAPWGITVNCVCPGATRTPLYDVIATPEQKQKRRRLIPAGRFCEPEDIAAAVAFLASEEAAMICGVTLPVDGGSLLGWYPRDEYPPDPDPDSAGYGP